MRTLLVLILVLAACKKKPAEPAVEGRSGAPSVSQPAVVERPPPDLATLQAVARRLSVRDPEPDCGAVEAELEADPVATFLYVIQTVERPPWAPMRAAGCLIDGHAAEIGPTLTGWVAGEETQGLGRLVLSRLRDLPDEVAVGVVRAGMRGPLAEVAAEAAAEDARDEVRQAGAAP